jgi:hypothetical protein
LTARSKRSAASAALRFHLHGTRSCGSDEQNAWFFPM